MHAHGVGSVHTACLALLDHSYQTDDTNLILRIANGPDSKMAENGNACTTCAYLSPTPGFFAPFYYCQCLCPYGQRCSDTNDGLFKRRVVSDLHILYMIEPGKGMRISSSVKHLHNMYFSAPSPQIHLRWTIDGRSKTGRFEHTLYFGTLHVYLRSAYACA